jgi:hypothetical protein
MRERRVPEIHVHPDEPNEPDDEQEEAPPQTGRDGAPRANGSRLRR